MKMYKEIINFCYRIGGMKRLLKKMLPVSLRLNDEKLTLLTLKIFFQQLMKNLKRLTLSFISLNA